MEKANLGNDIFEKFNEGELRLPGKTAAFKDIAWSMHPTFEGVELKHIITAKDTGGTFSYHLVRIAPNKSIKTHIHETQLETHEVIAGSGICTNDGAKLEYVPGVISIMPAKVPHQVDAGDQGLYLFAKFIPALC
ncbi:MAG: cupin domain-containing protein [Fibrobacter sp.]|uniref:cupin domain-containing protein n=1 Tax=Fibrobacter sp. TaxID=35828 RepID=UPI002A91B243|nr:cupin domain-containing protein [Fibrobacter sp.]MDY6263134.1 cupin domain-containing protein [Fibrobacter sp.]